MLSDITINELSNLIRKELILLIKEKTIPIKNYNRLKKQDLINEIINSGYLEEEISTESDDTEELEEWNKSFYVEDIVDIVDIVEKKVDKGLLFSRALIHSNFIVDIVDKGLLFSEALIHSINEVNIVKELDQKSIDRERRKKRRLEFKYNRR